MAMRLSHLRAKVWLFHLKHLKGERGQLCFNVTREVCDLLADHRLLVQVTDTFQCFFNFKTSTWGPQVRLSTLIHADWTSSWVVLEDGRVFCCGGGKSYAGCGEATAYIVARDGAVEQKTCMSEGRFGHGILSYNATYVFGGCML